MKLSWFFSFLIMLGQPLSAQQFHSADDILSSTENTRLYTLSLCEIFQEDGALSHPDPRYIRNHELPRSNVQFAFEESFKQSFLEFSFFSQSRFLLDLLNKKIFFATLQECLEGDERKIQQLVSQLVSKDMSGRVVGAGAMVIAMYPALKIIRWLGSLGRVGILAARGLTLIGVAAPVIELSLAYFEHKREVTELLASDSKVDRALGEYLIKRKSREEFVQAKIDDMREQNEETALSLEAKIRFEIALLNELIAKFPKNASAYKIAVERYQELLQGQIGS